MAVYAEFLLDNELALGVVEKREAKRVAIVTDRGRMISLSPDKILFEHSGASTEAVLTAIHAFEQDLDVNLLWQMLLEEGDTAAKQPLALAKLYFGADSSQHQSAVFRALIADRQHFRRHGNEFEPRPPAQLSQLQEQVAAETAVASEIAQLKTALATKTISAPLANRLDHFVRGQPDRLIQQVLSEDMDLSYRAQPERYAFDVLLSVDHYDFRSDFEVVQANYTRDFPEEVLAEAAKITADQAQAANAVPCAMTIDDAETREVDDGLSLAREGELWRIDIDIADPARVILPQSLVDQEALRRVTTAYLPTNIFYMIPESLSCDQLSLKAGYIRPALRLSVWLDEEGLLQRHLWQRALVIVQHRLSYHDADRLISAEQSLAGTNLVQLWQLAQKRREQRRQRGALMLLQREWKIRVSPTTNLIEVTPIDGNSPSRMLVAEMMILTNQLAAEEAIAEQIPIIFRTQAKPLEPLPNIAENDAAALHQLRGLIAPAAPSLYPAEHWGLGVSAYAQISSPLRRYTDLVQQRQLGALIEKRPRPYDSTTLLPLLATIEANERSAKRIEAVVTQRWALEFLAQTARDQPVAVEVIAAVHGGYKALVITCGAHGLLATRQALNVGDRLQATIVQIVPRRDILRLQPVIS